MATFVKRPAVGSVGQYQMSAKPFATGAFTVPATGDAPMEIVFPYVTSWFSIANGDDSVPIRVGFSANGTTGSNVGANENNFYVVANGDFQQFKLRVRSIFLLSATTAQSNVQIMAGLTGIVNDLFGPDDKPNYSGSVGVG